MRLHMHRIALLLCCCLLVACGSEETAAAAGEGDDGLPKPAAASGSVTGMPNPGVADARPAPRDGHEPGIVELPEPADTGAIAAPDPATLPMPIEGPPLMLPEQPMSGDPNALPPATPEPAGTRVPADLPQ